MPVTARLSGQLDRSLYICRVDILALANSQGLRVARRSLHLYSSHVSPLHRVMRCC